jgi:hypothetical protein
MIRSPLRAGIALACALSLSACGGGDGSVYVGGSATGVTKSGLVLTNNGGDDLAIPLSGTFYFATLLETDATYDVKVKSVPSNVDGIANCVVTNGTGKAVFTVSTVLVTCKVRTHVLGGTVIGLNGATGLVLVNGTDRKDIVPAATSTQTFSLTPVSEDVPYGVSVLTQPAGRTCAVENASGIMRDADIANVVVRCI